MDIKEIISSGILELYAAGLTTEVESATVEQWIIQYPEVAKELDEISASLEQYAMSNAVVPASSVKDKIFSSISATDDDSAKVVSFTTPTQAKVITGVAPFWRMVAAASVILLAGSLIFNFITYNKYTQTNNALADSQKAMETLKETNNSMADEMQVVKNKYSVPVSLKGLEAAPEAEAKIFWIKNTGDVFIDASNLPDVPAGKAYQLWGIVDGKPVSGGMILTTRKGDKLRMQKMSSFGKAEAFAITLEPEKGNPTPQGPMFVMGKM